MKKDRGSLVTSWMPPALCLGAILVVSSINGNALPDLNRHGMDKVAHLVEFAILAFLSMRALRRFWPRIDLAAACAVTAALVVVCAMIDEGRQLFMPNRSCDVFDLIFDFAGAVVGILVFTYLEEERDSRVSSDW